MKLPLPAKLPVTTAAEQSLLEEIAKNPSVSHMKIKFGATRYYELLDSLYQKFGVVTKEQLMLMAASWDIV